MTTAESIFLASFASFDLWLVFHNFLLVVRCFQ
jgi:hypothetical protein